MNSKFDFLMGEGTLPVSLGGEAVTTEADAPLAESFALEPLFPAYEAYSFKDVRFATYNVLHPEYARPERYPGVSEAHLDPRTRFEKIVVEIEAAMPSVLALQEVGDEFMAVAGDYLERLGYEYAAARQQGENSGTLLLWLRRDWGRTPNTEVVTVPTLGSEADPPLSEGEGEGVAVCVVLSPRRSDGLLVKSAFFFASVHLEGNPAKEGARVLQANELRRRAALSRANHAFLMGNFNATPDGSMYASLTHARPDVISLMGSNDGYVSMTQNVIGKSEEEAPTFHTGLLGARRVDYIFYRGLDGKSTPVQPKRGRIPRADRPMPDAFHPSDHVLVSVDAVLWY